jgi:predicted transcriptional regulator
LPLLKQFTRLQSNKREKWEIAEQWNLQSQTLDALESVDKGKVIAAKEVHEWLSSWGTDNELKAPTFKKDDEI